MSLLKVLLVVLFLMFLAFLNFGSFLIAGDKYWQRVRIFLKQTGEIKTETDDTEKQVKMPWKQLPPKERFSAHLPRCEF